MTFALTNHKNAIFNLSRNIMTLTLFGLIILSVVPAMFSGFFTTTTTTPTPSTAAATTNMVQTVMAQGEDPFPDK